MSTSTSASLSELLAAAASAGNDHTATEKTSGLQHIHNHANGTVVWFPTWQKFRETSDWEPTVVEQEKILTAATEDGTSLNEAAAALLAANLTDLLQRAAASTDANVFVAENLSLHLAQTWAIDDAVARKAGTELSKGKPSPAFAAYPYDIYAQDGGSFAAALWNDVIDAGRKRAIAEEAERKALKPVSRKALKNAARKAARR
ncbi:hypothetical protein ACQR35_05280 [Pseudarthrobacter sp. J1738]|uniref:hypothetical protein n=1 Tax=unclassified Pseudarthrobacter TaxID=2647000 RepID=UPI003D272170